jgi:hypothetical protein
MFTDTKLNLNTKKGNYYVEFRLIELFDVGFRETPIGIIGDCLPVKQISMQYIMHAWSKSRGEWVEFRRYESKQFNTIEMHVIEGSIREYEKAVYREVPEPKIQE